MAIISYVIINVSRIFKTNTSTVFLEMKIFSSYSHRETGVHSVTLLKYQAKCFCKIHGKKQKAVL